ncbi:MAG: cytochrome c maturation protein CcmE [Polyangia bacterium]|jgi:cytochrome c-type biogenesis protein CcmE
MSSPDSRLAGDERAKPQMTATQSRGAWKIVISVVVVAAALGGLLWASTREGAEYYKYVDEVLADAARYQGKRLRVHGDVVEGSLESDKASLRYRFKLTSRAPRAPAVIGAEFHGIPPDTFKAGAEVIAAGVLAPDGRLLADKIETKCPSKYEAK